MRPYKFILKLLLLSSLVLTSGLSHAQDLIMLRVKQSFPETMVSLQSAIKKTGYTISRVQRIDIGLTKSGFKTDKYRVVFFGKEKEVDFLTKSHPNIIPFLPLKISIFAENNETILISNNPLIMQSYFENIPKHYFKQWATDVQKIFSLTTIID